MKTNNVIITLGGNNAVLMTEGSYAKQGYKAFSASSSFISALQALDFILDKVSDNNTLDEKVSTIHVPDMLKGFAGHSFREYIRTNKTSSGRQFTEEEKQLVLSVATKMMNKGLNCEVKESKFFPKELKAMKDLAIKVAKEYKAQATQQTAPQAQPQQDPIALIGLQIAEAAAAGDMDKVMALTTALNALKAAQQTSPQAPVVDDEPVEETTDESDVEVDDELENMEC